MHPTWSECPQNEWHLQKNLPDGTFIISFSKGSSTFTLQSNQRGIRVPKVSARVKSNKVFWQKIRLLDILDTCPCFILYFPHVNSEIWSFVLLGWGLVASKLWDFGQGVPMVLSRDNPGNTWLKQAKILEQMVLYQRLCLEFDHVGVVNFLCSAKKFFFIYCKGLRF